MEIVRAGSCELEVKSTMMVRFLFHSSFFSQRWSFFTGGSCIGPIPRTRMHSIVQKDNFIFPRSNLSRSSQHFPAMRTNKGRVCMFRRASSVGDGGVGLDWDVGTHFHNTGTGHCVLKLRQARRERVRCPLTNTVAREIDFTDSTEPNGKLNKQRANTEVQSYRLNRAPSNLHEHQPFLSRKGNSGFETCQPNYRSQKVRP